MRKSGQIADANASINWAVLKQLIPYLMAYRLRIALALGFMVAAKLSTIVMPFLLKKIVDDLGQTGAASEESNQIAWLFTPVALVIAYGFFRLTNVLFGELRDTLFGRVTENAIRQISLSVFKHLHSLDVDFHLNRRTGGLARDIERGTHGINFLMRFMIFNIIPTLIEISLVIGILLTNYGLTFGLVTLLSVVVYITFSVLTTNWRNQFIRAANEADSQSNTRAIDSLLNYETVKFFTNEAYEAERYNDDLKVWERAKRKNRLTLFALNAGQALIISSAVTSLMFLAVVQVQQQQMSVGDFVLINAFMMQLFLPLNFLGFVYREIRTALINIEKMFVLLNRSPKVQDRPDGQRLDTQNAKINFDNVHFSYQQDREILKGVSFEILPQQTVAIVGSSGAGKSTIARLLLRFYQPTWGTISIGGQDICAVTQNSLRKSIGVVPQDAVLFNDSLFENIRYGDPSATEQAVFDAIKLAHLDRFVERLPEGVNTLVGERGLKLSGGEKQRVAIARALLKRPPIMIFDEATSSLDSRSESAILEAIQEISGNYTSLVIAHRLSTIINADKIIVLDEGQVKESGSHPELITKGGLYAELWAAQQSANHTE